MGIAILPLGEVGWGLKFKNRLSYSAEVKNECSLTSTSLIHLRALERYNFTFACFNMHLCMFCSFHALQYLRALYGADSESYKWVNINIWASLLAMKAYVEMEIWLLSLLVLAEGRVSGQLYPPAFFLPRKYHLSAFKWRKSWQQNQSRILRDVTNFIPCRELKRDPYTV